MKSWLLFLMVVMVALLGCKVAEAGWVWVPDDEPTRADPVVSETDDISTEAQVDEEAAVDPEASLHGIPFTVPYYVYRRPWVSVVTPWARIVVPGVRVAPHPLHPPAYRYWYKGRWHLHPARRAARVTRRALPPYPWYFNARIGNYTAPWDAAGMRVEEDAIEKYKVQ